MAISSGVIFADPLRSFIQGFQQAEEAELKLQDTLRGFRDTDRQFAFDVEADPLQLDDLRQSLRIRTTQANIAEALEQPSIQDQLAGLEFQEAERGQALQRGAVQIATLEEQAQQQQLNTRQAQLQQALAVGVNTGSFDQLNRTLQAQGLGIQVTGAIPRPDGRINLQVSVVDENGQINTQVVDPDALFDALFLQQQNLFRQQQIGLESQAEQQQAQQSADQATATANLITGQIAR